MKLSEDKQPFEKMNRNGEGTFNGRCRTTPNDNHAPAMTGGFSLLVLLAAGCSHDGPSNSSEKVILQKPCSLNRWQGVKAKLQSTDQRKQADGNAVRVTTWIRSFSCPS